MKSINRITNHRPHTKTSGKKNRIVHFRVKLKTPHFQNETKYTASLVKMSFNSHENENHSHKAEHLTSSWYRGPGELGNGLLVFPPYGVLRFAKVNESKANVYNTSSAESWREVCRQKEVIESHKKR